MTSYVRNSTVQDNKCHRPKQADFWMEYFALFCKPSYLLHLAIKAPSWRRLFIKAPGCNLTIEAVFEIFYMLENKCDGK